MWTADRTMASEQGFPLQNLTISSKKGETGSISMSDSFDPYLISDPLFDVFMIVNSIPIVGVISVFGMVTNIINIIVFTKQGFEATINITLIGIAVSDLLTLVFYIWIAVLTIPDVFEGLPINIDHLLYVTGGWPRLAFSRVTSWLTAYVTFERCLCVAIPLKVKLLMTPQRTWVVVITIYCLTLGSLLPAFSSMHFGWKFQPDLNTSIIEMIYSEGGRDIENISFLLNVLSVLASFVIVSVCTVVLVFSLSKKGQWREKSAQGNSDKTADILKKDRRIMKMVALISGLYICCNCIGCANMMAGLIQPHFNIGRKYTKLVGFLWSIVNIFESANASVNIFVYFRLSRSYRQSFRDLFGIGKIDQ